MSGWQIRSRHDFWDARWIVEWHWCWHAAWSDSTPTVRQMPVYSVLSQKTAKLFETTLTICRLQFLINFLFIFYTQCSVHINSLWSKPCCYFSAVNCVDFWKNSTHCADSSIWAGVFVFFYVRSWIIMNLLINFVWL